MGPLKRIIYNCRKATLLIEKKMSGQLSLREKIELQIHLKGCSFCRLYNEQSIRINLMVQQLFQSADQQEIKLNDEFKRELQELIDEELNKN
jgi:predicted anti-sigma-YlaC factor YlaD